MTTKTILFALLSISCTQALNVVLRAPPPQCETVLGQKCVFPFTYRGKTYRQCTFDSTTNGKAWCAYETREDGSAVPGKWEDCDPSLCFYDEDVCHTVSGPDTGNTCKFPFTFNGRTYHACAPWIWGGEGEGKKWCSTKTDRFGNHINGEGNYGFCGDCGYDYELDTRIAGAVEDGTDEAAANGEESPSR